MVTSAQLKEELGPIVGFEVWNLRRYLADLAGRGLAAQSMSGKDVQLNDLQITHVLLSLAAPSPLGAADAVRKLQGLMSPKVTGGGSFSAEFAGMLTHYANQLRRGIEPEIPDDWQMVVCLDPAQVTITTNGKSFVYQDDPGSEPAFQRHTVFKKAVFLTAIRLVADSQLASGVLVEPNAKDFGLSRPITMLPEKLRAYAGTSPSHPTLWRYAVAGTLPKVEQRGVKWVFFERDIPEIAASLGLKPI